MIVRGNGFLRPRVPKLVVTVFIALTSSSGSEPVINVWYGNTQAFGALGNPQQWVNILGSVNDAAGISSLTYTLNGGPSLPLARGPDTRRLQETGDFNAEISLADLLNGTNDVLFRATNGQGATSTRAVALTYTAGRVWPSTFTADWGAVSRVQDRAQVIDGAWTIDGGAVRPVVLGYSRAFAIGDLAWENYEITCPVTIRSIDAAGFVPPSAAPGCGVIARWTGHRERVPGEQPRTAGTPVGGALWYGFKFERLSITDFSALDVPDMSGSKLELGTAYVWKLRVQTLPIGDTLYAAKVWPASEAEPAAWSLATTDDSTDVASGSALFTANYADALFGKIDIVETRFPATPTLVASDDFTGAALDTGTWTFVNPLGDASYAMTGTEVAVTVPAGVDHNVWREGNRAPRIMQATGDTDLDVEAAFTSMPALKYQLQGILVEQDDRNFVVFYFYSDGAAVRTFAASFADLVPAVRFDTPVAGAAAPLALRVARAGNLWVLWQRIAGGPWTRAGAFSHTLVANRVGSVVGTTGSAPPAFTASVDRFINHARPPAAFRRGDANHDGVINIADPVFVLGYLFRDQEGIQCLDAADANDDGRVNVADPVRLLGYLFRQESSLPEPYAVCGVDPTADAVSCDKFPPCVSSK
jgi:hypothetical protein